MGSTPAGLTTAEHQVGQPIDLDREASLDHGGRAVLLDDQRALSPTPCRQVVAPVGHEARPPAGGAAAAAGRGRLQTWTIYAAQPGDLPVDELQHLSSPVGVAVDPLMLVVEGGRCGLWVERLRGRHGDLVRLAQVPGVNSAHEGHALVGYALGAQRPNRLGFELSEGPLDLGQVDLVVAPDQGDDVVILEIHREQAEGRYVARARWDEDGAEAEQLSDPAGLERTRATEGDQRIAGRIDATLDGELEHRIGLVVRRDLEDALGGSLQREAKRLGDPGYTSLSQFPTEPDGAAGQQFRRATEDEVGVRDGGLLSTPAVGHRPWVCTGAARADAQPAVG